MAKIAAPKPATGPTDEAQHESALHGAKLLSGIADAHVKHLHSLTEGRKAKKQAKTGGVSPDPKEQAAADGPINPGSGDISKGQGT